MKNTKNQQCKYDRCLVNLQYTTPSLHILKEWNMLFQFLELLPTALGCCVVCELLLSVIIELICGHQTTSIDIACSFVSFFFSYFSSHVYNSVSRQQHISRHFHLQYKHTTAIVVVKPAWQIYENILFTYMQKTSKEKLNLKCQITLTLLLVVRR